MIAASVAALVLCSIKFDGQVHFEYSDSAGPSPIQARETIELLPSYRGFCWVNLHGASEPTDPMIIIQLIDDVGLGFQLQYIRIGGQKTFEVTATSQTDFGEIYGVTARINESVAEGMDLNDAQYRSKWTAIAFEVTYSDVAGSDAIDVKLWVVQKDDRFTGSYSIANSSTAFTGSAAPSQRFNAKDSPPICIGGDGTKNFVGEIAECGLAAGPWNAVDLDALFGKSIFSISPPRSFGDVVPTEDIRFFAPFSLERPFDDKYGLSLDRQGLGQEQRFLGPRIQNSHARPTILVMGDTQNIGNATAYQKLADYTAAYRHTFNIRALFHVGDWLNSWHQSSSVRVVPLLHTLLDARIPFSLSMGNHEFHVGGRNYRDSCAFRMMLNEPFDGRIIEDEVFHRQNGWFQRRMNPPNPLEPLGGTEEDIYTYSFTFTVGSETHLAIVLPFGATPRQLDWVQTEAARHSAQPVWLIAHAWLYVDNEQLATKDVCAGPFPHPTNYFCSNPNSLCETHDPVWTTSPCPPPVFCDASLLPLMNPDQQWRDYISELETGAKVEEQKGKS